MAQFQVFTYQFYEVKGEQLSLFDEPNVVDSSVSMDHKQELFEAEWADKDKLVFKCKDVEYQHKLLAIENHIIVFRIANNKKVRRENDFQLELLDHKPSCLVVIDNRHDCQQIAIQRNKAFSKQTRVAEILQWTFCEMMKKHRLRMEVKARYDVKEFWSIVHRYPVGVKYLKFSFTPKNLPWLAGRVKQFFNEMGDNFYADPVLELNAKDDAPLNIREDDEMLGEMLSNSADSGMPIKMTMVGSKSQITCGINTTVEVSMSDSIVKELAAPQWRYDSQTTSTTMEHIVELVNEIKLLHGDRDSSCSEGLAE